MCTIGDKSYHGDANTDRRPVLSEPEHSLVYDRKPVLSFGMQMLGHQ